MVAHPSHPLRCLFIAALGRQPERACENLSQESARALMDYAVTHRFPVGNGILTVDTEQQAWVRARMEEADKGGDAVRACLAMVRLKRRAAAG